MHLFEYSSAFPGEVKYKQLPSHQWATMTGFRRGITAHHLRWPERFHLKPLSHFKITDFSIKSERKEILDDIFDRYGARFENKSHQYMFWFFFGCVCFFVSNSGKKSLYTLQVPPLNRAKADLYLMFLWKMVIFLTKSRFSQFDQKTKMTDVMLTATHFRKLNAARFTGTSAFWMIFPLQTLDVWACNKHLAAMYVPFLYDFV